MTVAIANSNRFNPPSLPDLAVVDGHASYIIAATVASRLPIPFKIAAASVAVIGAIACSPRPPSADPRADRTSVTRSSRPAGSLHLDALNGRGVLHATLQGPSECHFFRPSIFTSMNMEKAPPSGFTGFITIDLNALGAGTVVVGDPGLVRTYRVQATRAGDAFRVVGPWQPQEINGRKLVAAVVLELTAASGDRSVEWLYTGAESLRGDWTTLRCHDVFDLGGTIP